MDVFFQVWADRNFASDFKSNASLILVFRDRPVRPRLPYLSGRHFQMRTVRGVVAALALMAGVVLLFLVPLSIIMGPQRALDDSLAFNSLWVGISMVVCLIAACIGGWVVHRLSGSLGAVIGLVVVVAVLGLLDAAWHQWFLPVRFLV